MTKEATTGQKPSKKTLDRSLGVFSVFAICTGAAFSSGFFLLPGMAADVSGPSLPIAYLAAGILMLPAILSISELSAAMPRSGGPYFFVTRSFGALLGMVGAFGKFIQLILKGAFAFVGVGIYLSLLVEVSTEIVAVVLIIFFTGINLLGVRQTATTEKVLVIILLIILTYFLIAGGVQISMSNIDFQENFLPLLPFGWDGFFTAIALVFISFGGVAQVASVAEEVKNPGTSFPRGILWSLGVSSFFYLAGVALMITLVPPNALQGDETPVASAVEEISSWPFPVHVIVIAALAAFASTGNAAILSASRYPYALARDRLLWTKFGALTEKGVPKNGVLLSGALTIALVLLLNVKEIAKVASAFLLFVFLSLCLAVILFRESKKKDYQPTYKSPLYPWMQIFGSIVYLWLIYKSGPGAVAFIAGVIISGFLWYSYGIKEKPHLSPAIYAVLLRILPGKVKNSLQAGNLSSPGRGLSTAIENSIFIDLEQEQKLEDVIQRAAEALSNRVGGKKEKITEILREEVRHWKNPFQYNISAAPALLQGIEQPEMVIIRGHIKVGEKDLDGLIVVVDDENSSNRLIETLSQLELAIMHSRFPETWKRAEGAAEIKRSLIIDVGAVYINIHNSAPSGKWINSKLRNIELPEHCVIGAVNRNGELMAPEGGLQIRDGDEIILIGHGRAFEEIAEEFSNIGD